MISKCQSKKMLEFLATLTPIQVKDIMECGQLWGDGFHNIEFESYDLKKMRCVYVFDCEHNEDHKVEIYAEDGEIKCNFK